MPFSVIMFIIRKKSGYFTICVHHTYPLIASWRDKQGKVFIFLLEINECTQNNKPDYLAFVAGDSRLVKPTSRLIGEHKENLEKIEKRDLAGKRADKSLQDEINRKSIERFTKIVGIFAVIVNGFSLYLRSMPAPKIGNEFLKSIYEVMLVFIHFGALSLLFLIIFLAIAYTIKFGALMLRRGA